MNTTTKRARKSARFISKASILTSLKREARRGYRHASKKAEYLLLSGEDPDTVDVEGFRIATERDVI